MTYIHGLGSSVIDYVISNIPIYNQVVNFAMHKGSIEEHSDNQRHLLFDKQKFDAHFDNQRYLIFKEI